MIICGIQGGRLLQGLLSRRNANFFLTYPALGRQLLLKAIDKKDIENIVRKFRKVTLRNKKGWM